MKRIFLSALRVTSCAVCLFLSNSFWGYSVVPWESRAIEDAANPVPVGRLDSPNNTSSSYYIPQRNKALAEQLYQENSIYEIRFDFDLRKTFSNLSLNVAFSYGDGTFYRNRAAVSLLSGQTIWVPDGCEVMNSELTTIVSSDGIYTPISNTRVYIISLTASNICYQVNGILEIPKNCVLKFEGGRLYNGVLVGNNTRIESRKEAIFSGITIAGDWLVPKITSEWFLDITQENKLGNLISLSSNDIFNEVVIEKGDYFFSSYTNLYIGIQPRSNTKLTILGNIHYTNNYTTGYIIRVLWASNVTICGNGTLIGDRPYGSSGADHQTFGVSVSASKNVTINGIRIEKCFDGIYTASTVQSESITIKNNTISNCARQGITIDSVTNCIIENNTISNIGGWDPQSGIDIEHHKKTESDTHFIKNITIRHNSISGCNGACISISSSNTNDVRSDCILIMNNELDGGNNDGIRYGKGVTGVQIDENHIKGTIRVLPKNYSGCFGAIIKNNTIECDNFCWGVGYSTIENNKIICENIFGSASKYKSISYNHNTSFKNNVIQTSKIGYIDYKGKEVLRFDGDSILFEGNTVSSNTAMILDPNCSNIKIINNTFNRRISGKNQNLFYAVNCHLFNNVFNIIAIENDATMYSLFANVGDAIIDGNKVNNLTGELITVGRFAALVQIRGKTAVIKNTEVQKTIVFTAATLFGWTRNNGYSSYVEPFW